MIAMCLGAQMIEAPGEAERIPLLTGAEVLCSAQALW